MFELNLLGSGVFTTAGRLVEGFEDIGGEKDGRRGIQLRLMATTGFVTTVVFAIQTSLRAKTWGKHSTMASLSPSSIASCILSRLILVTSWQARPALLADSLAVPPEVVIDPENLTQTI